MNWKTLIEKRHTTFAWDTTTIPDEELIMDVLKEVYENIPSKNLQFPYQVKLLRNDDPIIQKEIMTICKRNSSVTVEEDRGNPQVLAPWLIGFSARYVADLEVRYETTSPRGLVNGLGKGKTRTNDVGMGQTQTENIEIGIMSAYIMLAMANRGIQTGMCQNVVNGYQRMSSIFKINEDERNLDFRFMIGVGFGKDVDTKHDYFDPRIGADRPIPFAPSDVEKVYPRPAIDDVIKVIK